MKLPKRIMLITLQFGIVIGLTVLFKDLLELIPVPDVFKNLSIVELNELDQGLIQAAANLKMGALGEIDTNICIINIETINPVPRGQVAKTIRMLKDNGAKTIALSFYLDQSYDDIDPTWDTSLASAIAYKEKNVIGLMGLQYFPDEEDDNDITLIPPLDKFEGFYDIGHGDIVRTAETEGAIVRKFNPTMEYKGEKYKSFALATAYHFDSTRVSAILDRTEPEHINFYDRKWINIWDMSWLENPIIVNEFIPQIKDKLFVIGYVTDPYEFVRTSYMENTPIGKLDYCLIQTFIINDILIDNLALDSPFWIDMLLGAFYGLFNILFYLYATRKTLMWEKFTGGNLLLIEIVFNYLFVLIVFLASNYKLSVTIPSIVIMISIPLNNILHHRLIPLYNQISARIKFPDIPYYLLKLFINLFKTKTRATRYSTLIFGFQRLLWLYSAFRQMISLRSNSNSEYNADINKEVKMKNMEEPDIKELLSETFQDNINSYIKVTDEYHSLFAYDNLKREFFRRIDANRDVAPNQDKFKDVFPLFVNLMKFAGKELKDYQFIYTIKKTDDKYLILKISTSQPEAEYLFSEQELALRAVYLNKKGTSEFINMTPLIFYKQCKYHMEKELFIFANIRYDTFTGKETLHYVGEQFVCSPTTPYKGNS